MRPINKTDYVQFFGKNPDRTIRGYSVLLDNEIAAVFGILIDKRGEKLMFSDMKQVDVPKITICRWARKALEMLSDVKPPIYALTNGSDKFLNSLGFHFCGDTKYGKLYEYLGRE